jgi:hypothetical protein
MLPDAYTMQFSAVLSQSKAVRSRKPISGHSGHHWFVEVPYNDIATDNYLPKTKLLSAVISNKCDTPVHRQRFEFMKKLKEHFGDRLDWRGRGVSDTGANKLVGLADYKYHIVIENGQWINYWTEKIADAYAANCFPFYSGAPNIREYFPEASMTQIDIFDAPRSIAIMENAIAGGIFEAAQPALKKAREMLLSEHHPYRVYRRILESLPYTEPTDVTIKPHNAFAYSIPQRVRSRLGMANN